MKENIYFVWSDKLIKNINPEIKQYLIKIDNLNNFSKWIKVLSLHSASTINKIISDSKISSKKWIDYIWCNENIWKIFIDKSKTKDILSNLWFSVPKWIKTIWNKNKIENLINTYNLNFPILIKELDNTWWQWIYVLQSLEDITKLKLNPLLDYIIEEFVEWEEFSCMIFVYNSKFIIFPPIIKWKTWINKNWDIIHALEKIRTNFISYEINEKIRELVEKIWKIKWVNWFIDFDFILDKKDSILKLLEINPRVSWITDISFASSSIKMDDIIFLLLNEEKYYSQNVLKSKIIVEYPIIFEEQNFEEKELNIDWWKILKNICLRKFKPYMQKVLIEFDSESSYNNFIKNYKYEN